MKNFPKLILSALLCLTFAVSSAQVQQVTVTGDIKGLHAVRVCLMTGNRGDDPREVAYAVADNGKFKMTFEEDPSQGRRYAFYIPTLDTEQHDNKKSREYFFVDAPKIQIVGQADGSGIQSFNLPKSKMYQQFKEARAKIDFNAFYAQGEVEHNAMEAIRLFQHDWESTHKMGDVMSREDSLKFREVQRLWKVEADKFFDLEHGLGFQVLDQVTGKKHNRGVNAMIFDHFNGFTATAMQPVIDKYVAEFGPGYMQKDFYLSQLWDYYVQRSMKNPGALVYDFPFMTIDGKEVRLSQFKGKYIYANFWDLEDPDHPKQQEALEALYEQFRNSPNVVILNVSMNRDPALWRAILTSTTMKCPQWSVPEGGDVVFYKSYKVHQMPRAVLIAPDFTILKLEAPVPADPTTAGELGRLSVGK